MEDFFDSVATTCPWVKAENPNFESAPALELTADGPVSLPARRVVVADLILGVGGALLAHVIVAAAFLFLRSLPPQRSVQEHIVKVYLAGAGRIAGNSRGGGLSDWGGSAKFLEETPPRAITVEDTTTPDDRKTTRTSEGIVQKARSRKTAVSAVKTRITSNPKTPSADPAENISGVEKPAPQKAGGELSGGKAQGVGNGGETGARTGVSGPDTSSFGTGPSGEYDAVAVDQVPRILKRIEPAYPNRARNLGISGKVAVRILVETDGRVSRPSIVEAHPAGYFEQSTLEAVRHWLFKPGCHKGRVVSTWVTVPVQFRLIDQE